MRSSPKSGEPEISVAIVDTGPLLAAVSHNEHHHERCVEVLSRGDLRPVIPTMVVAEAAYMVSSRVGPGAEVKFLRELLAWEIESPTRADWLRIAELTERYSDLPLGATDASIVALAERLEATKLITLDRKHFSVVQPLHAEGFELLPA